MVKKVVTLKYLILICAMIMSFFIFSNVGVGALDYSVNDGKIILNLEFVDNEDASKGYVITGARTTCVNSDCVVDWEIPTAYDGNSIVAIGASDDTVSSVLSNISKVISGKIIVGNSLQTIGACAFCDFDYVEEINLGESVSSIGEYAFAYNSALKIISINAFNGGVRSALENSNAFSLSPNIEKIVFKNPTIANTYKTNVKGWNTVDIKFTYKVLYRFYDNNNELVEMIETYVDEKIGKVPASINRVGFNFKWVSKHNENIEITADSNAREITIDAELGPLHDVGCKWDLKNGNIYIKTLFEETEKLHTGSNNSIEIDYKGKNKILDIETMVEHPLSADPNLAISYSWEKIISGIKDENYSVGKRINVARVADTGIYLCNVTISYLGYASVSQSVSIEVRINPKKLIINIKNLEEQYGTIIGAEMDWNQTYYVVDESTSLVDGEFLQFDFQGYNQRQNIGTYNGVLHGTVSKVWYEGDNVNNYVNDYDIEYVPGDLTIVPKVIDLSFQEDIVLEYGEEEVLQQTISENIYGEERVLIVEYVREEAANKNVGRYSPTQAYIIFQGSKDNNYDVNLDANGSGKIIINPRKVYVSWMIDNNLVYNGDEKIVSASYMDVESNIIDLNVSITKGGESSVLVNAGEYQLMASLIYANNNYELVANQKIIQIEKADSVFEGSQRQITTYNGLPQRVNVSLNHSEGTIVYGDYSSCKNAHSSTSGTCTISVSVEETENYKGISDNFYLHINPYILTVRPEVFEFDYGTVIGQYNLCGTYQGVNEEQVTVFFAKEGSHTDLTVGSYNIVSAYLIGNTNYKVTMEDGSGLNKIIINKAPVEVRFYFYEGLVYDGNEKNIGIRYFGTNEDVGLIADYGDKPIKNAGDYRIDVAITNNNFYIDGNDYLEFSIAKANYDMSNVKLNDLTVKFDFKSHFINLEGDLPQGLIAIYTIDDQHGNGTYLPFAHTIKVTFEGDFTNYNRVAPLEATLYVNMNWVFMVLSLFIFVFGVIPVVFIILVKKKIIRLPSRVRTSVVRKLIKKSREIDEMYRIFKEKKEEVSEDDELARVIVEENIRFIKNQVKVSPEEQIELSFVDELFKSNYGTKQIYSEVKNELLSYDGVVSKIKRDYETFYLNNLPIAKLDVVKGVLYAYFALDPTQYREEEYNHEKVTKNKDFASVPLKLKVNSIDSLRHAKMFIRIMRKREGLKFVSNFVRVDYVSIYTSKDHSLKLFKKAFVKKGTKEYFED